MAKATVKTTAVASGTTKVSETEELLPLIKEAFKESRGRDVQLPDKVLVMVIDLAKDWNDRDDDAKLELLELAETTAKDIMISDPGITTLIAKLDAEFIAEMDKCILAVVKGKTTAVDILAQMKRVYTKNEMDGMVMPGTEAEHVVGTNYRADKIKTKDKVSGDPITVVWTNDFADKFPQAANAVKDLADCEKEIKSPSSVARFKGKDKDDLAAIKASATQVRNAVRSIVKRSIKLHHRWSAIEMLPGCNIRWIPGTKDKGISMPTSYGEGEIGKNAEVVTLSPKPIWIYSKADPSKGRDFSVTQVLSFQPDLAKLGENGGNLADLVATAGKGSDDGDDADKSGDGSKMEASVAQATLSQAYNFLNNGDNMRNVRMKMAAHKKDADGKDWLDLIGRMYLLLKPVYDGNKAAIDEVLLNENFNAGKSEKAA